MCALVRAIHEGQALTALRSEAAKAGPLRGRIVGRFTGGFYARVRDQIFAAGGPAIWPGPIHLILEQAPELQEDDGEVCMSATSLQYPGGALDLASAGAYAPEGPSIADLRSSAPLLAYWAGAAQPPEDLETCWDRVRAAVSNGDIAGAGTVLQGRGIGLTPSGDDVLAGLLLFARWSGSSEGSLTSIAEQAQTTDLSRSFLRWAARGQSIAPVHALVSDDPTISSRSTADRCERFDEVAAIVCQVGHRSGSALMTGLGMAAATWIGSAGGVL